MNSCLVIFLLLGANPADRTATTRFITPVMIFPTQVALDAEPAETAADFVVPRTVSQPRPIQPFVAPSPYVQLVQGDVAPPPPPYDEQPLPMTAVDSYAETIVPGQEIGANWNYGSACAGQGGNGCQSNGCDTCSPTRCGLFGTRCEDSKYRCWDSTYDMPLHHPYSPAYHGYYYYRPYNYRHVLDHTDHLLGDSSIAPYFSTVFEHLYAEFPKKSYNPDPADNSADGLIPPAPAKLPNLTDLLDGGSDD